MVEKEQVNKRLDLKKNNLSAVFVFVYMSEGGESLSALGMGRGVLVLDNHYFFTCHL